MSIITTETHIQIGLYFMSLLLSKMKFMPCFLTYAKPINTGNTYETCPVRFVVVH